MPNRTHRPLGRDAYHTMHRQFAWSMGKGIAAQSAAAFLFCGGSFRGDPIAILNAGRA